MTLLSQLITILEVDLIAKLLDVDVTFVHKVLTERNMYIKGGEKVNIPLTTEQVDNHRTFSLIFSSRQSLHVTQLLRNSITTYLIG